ncbi:MAG TPA: thermonuclease family protein [Gaiella sp.]|jgi:micrococcal nuclease|nr:thermonuclease family protein [Gaiella sp.]
MAARAGLMLVVVLALLAGSADAHPTAVARVARVIDGDTIVLANGAHVRLLQIDTPEPGTSECYSRAAGRDLRRMLPAGSVVTLETDPALDRVDRYGRLLRYVHRGGSNVNLALVQDGSATVWFFDGDRGRYASALLVAARSARHARRGLWGACPHAIWDPFGPATTGPGSGTGATTPRTAVGGACDPSYPTVCIPPPPPDLDCKDIPYRRFAVRPPDPHHFDGGGDGVGCES